MIALRPPSYHTIEDPPPYPDDDVEDCPLTGVPDKRTLRLPRESAAASNRARVGRYSATAGELLRLRSDEDVDHRMIQQAARQFRSAVGSHRRRTEPAMCSREGIRSCH